MKDQDGDIRKENAPPTMTSKTWPNEVGKDFLPIFLEVTYNRWQVGGFRSKSDPFFCKFGLVKNYISNLMRKSLMLAVLLSKQRQCRDNIDNSALGKRAII